MESQTYSFVTARPFAPPQELLREAAPDLYEACKLVLDRNRSGYSLFSHRATVALEAAVAKAEGRKSSQLEEMNGTKHSEAENGLSSRSLRLANDRAK